MRHAAARPDNKGAALRPFAFRACLSQPDTCEAFGGNGVKCSRRKGHTGSHWFIGHGKDGFVVVVEWPQGG